MEKLINKQLIISLVVIVIGILLYLIISKVIKNISNRNTDKRKKTYINLMNSFSKYLILIIVVIIVLQVNGINVTSIIAGLGVVSVIAGLALQDALKDMIMGFNIIFDGYFSVGDVIKIGDVYGKVMELGLKSTKLKDINNDNILVIGNRNIGDALTISNQLDIDVPISYDTKLVKVEEVFDNIVKRISNLSNVDTVNYKGLNEFGDSAIFYKVRIQAKPEYQPQLKRDANKIIKEELDKNGIEIPFMQIDIHNR